MPFDFGRWTIDDTEVFYIGEYSFAFVNLRPIRKHHVLVCPIRKVERLKDLELHELSEMMKIASLISQKIANGACNIAIQDGIDAGQTVNHVHIHVVPREGEGILHIDRLYGDRSPAQMAAEATILRSMMQDYHIEECA
ncbi:unnamed protein product [Blepharisma stoltei]|uniref:HIT domain-containing protein n=1 Tax=Blepharisma stoltei TaxID=1481888 RepID=A0AAU9K6N5_9CILI|nr:unnamed protein product [Blepharisma stoltei]